MLTPKFVICTLGSLAGAFVLGMTNPAQAQVPGATELQPWEFGGQTDAATNANNPLSTRDGTGGGSLFQLLNRIQLLQDQSGADFARNQEKQFNSAVEDFQKKQQEAFDSPEQE